MSVEKVQTISTFAATDSDVGALQSIETCRQKTDENPRWRTVAALGSLFLFDMTFCLRACCLLGSVHFL